MASSSSSWECHACTYVNTNADDTSCEICDTARLRPGLWACLKCTFDNDEKVNACEMCGAGRHRDQRDSTGIAALTQTSAYGVDDIMYVISSGSDCEREQDGAKSFVAVGDRNGSGGDRHNQSSFGTSSRAVATVNVSDSDEENICQAFSQRLGETAAPLRPSEAEYTGSLRSHADFGDYSSQKAAGQACLSHGALRKVRSAEWCATQPMRLAVRSTGDTGRTAVLFDGETCLSAVLPALSIPGSGGANGDGAVESDVEGEHVKFRANRVIKVSRCFYRAGRIVVLRMQDVCALSASSVYAASLDVGLMSSSTDAEGGSGQGHPYNCKKQDRLIPRVAMLRSAPCPHCRLSVAIHDLEEHARDCRKHLAKLIEQSPPGPEQPLTSGFEVFPRLEARSRQNSSTAASNDSLCPSQSQNDSQESLPLRVLQQRIRRATRQQRKRNQRQMVDTRPVCKYGARCYRRNADHLRRFAHPQNSSALPPPSASTRPQRSQASNMKQTALSANTSAQKQAAEAPARHRKLRRSVPVAKLPEPSQPCDETRVANSMRCPPVIGSSFTRVPRCLESSSTSNSDSDSLNGFIVRDETDCSNNSSDSDSDSSSTGGSDECNASNGAGDTALRRLQKHKRMLSGTRPSLYESQESQLDGSPILPMDGTKRRRTSSGAAAATANFAALTPDGSASPASLVATTPAALTVAPAASARQVVLAQQDAALGSNPIISPPAVAAGRNRINCGTREPRSSGAVPNIRAALSSSQAASRAVDKQAAAKLVSARAAVNAAKVAAAAAAHCPHGPAAVATVKKAGPNQGRPFFACGASYADPTRCGNRGAAKFFGWLDTRLDPASWDLVANDENVPRQRTRGTARVMTDNSVRLKGRRPRRAVPRIRGRSDESDAVDAGLAMNGNEVMGGMTFF